MSSGIVDILSLITFVFLGLGGILIGCSIIFAFFKRALDFEWKYLLLSLVSLVIGVFFLGGLVGVFPGWHWNSISCEQEYPGWTEDKGQQARYEECVYGD
ncbi:MAG: hypothetical protein CL887_06735 [Dehalococcoidia bacterium]|nr:hypothetical protein [Chloroflexota bacterium]MBR98170.1 hypothetical protein [Dehalococcoidia bacterium]|tara:strand:- start:1037 stop:1336 length:300 start_codon:yes stop_codon:yes gene_type:complete